MQNNKRKFSVRVVENLETWEEDNREEEDETPHEFGTPGSFTVEEGLKKEEDK